MSLLAALAPIIAKQTATPPASGITFLGGDAAGGDSNNTDDLVLSGPSVTADDYAVMFYYSDGAGSTNVYAEIDTPTDWTLHPDFPQSNTGGRDRKIWMFVRRFSGATTATATLSVNNGQSRARGAVMGAWDGVDPTTALDVTPEYGFASNDNTPSSPSITPATDNGAIVAFVGFNAGASRTVTWSSAEPAGMTLSPDQWSSDRTWGAMAYILDDGTADATGVLTWTPGGMDSGDESGMITVALRAA